MGRGQRGPAEPLVPGGCAVGGGGGAGASPGPSLCQSAAAAAACTTSKHFVRGWRGAEWGQEERGHGSSESSSPLPSSSSSAAIPLPPCTSPLPCSAPIPPSTWEGGTPPAGTRGGGRRRPCSGCFSVLSEESTSMAWSTGDVDEGPAGRRERTRRESERPAQVARGRGHVPQLGQEAPGAHAAWAGEAPVTQRGPTRGRSRGSRRPLTAPRGPAAPHQP
ncbi:uncharacterized protein [Anser cygnoides]|uniref:uncharacterized protein isoform X2 n=1 Tax=Anser cygnoides TaxID=8845 RepID=UPI0034D2104E